MGEAARRTAIFRRHGGPFVITHPARPQIVLLLAIVLGLGGCKSIWASFTSPSDSVSGSSTSISGSSEAFFDGISQSCSGATPSPAQLSYGDDVRVLSQAWANRGEPAAELMGALAVVAEQHGINDWEAEIATYHGLGIGFAQAGYDNATARDYLAKAGIHGTEALLHVEEGSAAVLR